MQRILLLFVLHSLQATEKIVWWFQSTEHFTSPQVKTTNKGPLGKIKLYTQIPFNILSRLASWYNIEKLREQFLRLEIHCDLIDQMILNTQMSTP